MMCAGQWKGTRLIRKRIDRVIGARDSNAEPRSSEDVTADNLWLDCLVTALLRRCYAPPTQLAQRTAGLTAAAKQHAQARTALCMRRGLQSVLINGLEPNGSTRNYSVGCTFGKRNQIKTGSCGSSCLVLLRVRLRENPVLGLS
jgi:hypothetical protein